jgi:D-threonate/D-erythronate kinase
MQLPGLSIAIVADDLTGACDTALQFFSSHAKTHVLLDFQRFSRTEPSQEHLQENQVWSINTSTRHTDPQEAKSLIRQAVTLCRERFGVETFYKKIDSTLRGNIAQECLSMLEEMKAQCAVIAPAYPQEGRRTVGGYQLVRGIPVEKVVGRDPLCPVRQSHLPTLLEQQSTPELVGYIPLSLVLHGAGPILVKLNELIKDGKKLVVVDATSNEDLEQIALAIEKAQKNARVLPCGSAGLAQALADLWAIEPEESPVVIPFHKKGHISMAPSPVLIVSGSNTEITRQQILKLTENYAYYGQNSQIKLFDLTPDQILGLTPLEDLIRQIVEALGEHNTVVLSTALKEESYIRTLSLAAEHHIPEQEASQKAQEVLARITAEVAHQKTVKLILAGGETTCEVCARLNIQQLEIIARADESIPVTLDHQGRWIITKSGGFGSPLALANIIKFIKQKESSSVHA